MDLLEPHLERMREWAAALPALPAGYQYRIETKEFFPVGPPDETYLTVRAVPTKILHFND
jgi:hypothetical protein